MDDTLLLIVGAFICAAFLCFAFFFLLYHLLKVLILLGGSLSVALAIGSAIVWIDSTELPDFIKTGSHYIFTLLFFVLITALLYVLYKPSEKIDEE